MRPTRRFNKAKLVLSVNLQVIFQKRVRVFYRGFQTRENWWKPEAVRPRAFTVFECLETPVKHETRVFEMASQSAPNCKQMKTKEQKKAKITQAQRTVCDDNVRVFHNWSSFISSSQFAWSGVLLVPKHRRVTWGWILLVSTKKKILFLFLFLFILFSINHTQR